MLELIFPIISLFLVISGYYRIVRSHERSESHVRHAAYASLFFLACFAAISLAVSFSGRASGLDYRVFSFFQETRSSGVVSFATSLSSLFDPLKFLAFAVFFEAALFVRNHRREALLSSSILAFAFLLDWSSKVLIGSNRPFIPDMATLGYSFPSGHAALAAAFFLTLYFFARDHLKDWEQKVGLLILAILLSLLVGASRLILGVHWFSDVIGGFLIGGFSVFFVFAQFSLPTEKRKR